MIKISANATPIPRQRCNDIGKDPAAKGHAQPIGQAVQEPKGRLDRGIHGPFAKSDRILGLWIGRLRGGFGHGHIYVVGLAFYGAIGGEMKGLWSCFERGVL